MPVTSPEPESSEQALERFVARQLEGLSLSAHQDDVVMIARFVEEEGIEPEEKIEGIKSMLDDIVDSNAIPKEYIDGILSKIVDEQKRLKQLDLERQAAKEEATCEPPAEKDKQTSKDILATLTSEELAAVKRQTLLRQYGYVDADENELNSLFVVSRGDAPPRGSKKVEDEKKHQAEERKKLIEEALKRDGKRKQKKNEEVDLLAPNLNKEKAHHVMAMQREAQKMASQQKKDRDRAALEKQRADQARAKAEKQKKAAKQERRA
ncbi:uncharacterized protein L203_104382 [Cryptococcus depauperatus CBS 7841]|uniref:Uncharacterized protein n=1 Tax=Cryptococcus depauperatus CBS 7841 TaxID=1295531 RepID=A0A1E3IIJ1_9TREE|nr:hypothetical protein L203_03318 [Cryptococcus depauperatus CBS 7841]